MCRARKGLEMVRYNMHRPSAVDIRFSSCPYCFKLDDCHNGVGQKSVCNDGFIGVNDGFYECDAIARTEVLVNTMAIW